MTKRDDAIQMSVRGLTLDPVTKTPIVILKDTDNKLNLPIWIGLLEATAMATQAWTAESRSACEGSDRLESAQKVDAERV